MPWNTKKALNKYILMQEDSPEKADLLKVLKRVVTSPKEVAEYEFLPADHILKREAILVSDAFEALTNGMFNDDILLQLSEISNDSLFGSWKILIESLYAFYSKNWMECKSKLKTIPDGTAPSLFKELFRSIFDGKPNDDWDSLKSSILEDNSEIQDSLGLIRDASGIEDVLLDTASMLIRELLRDDLLTCEKIMIWCFDHLQITDLLSDKAVDRAKTLFGEKEGYRLAALASISFDPDRSLVYWLHSLIAYLDGCMTQIDSVKAYLTIIKDIAETVKLEFELTPEYIRLLKDLVNELSESLYHLYPEIPGQEIQDENPFISFEKLAGQKPALPGTRKVSDVVQPVVQLELFSF